MNASFAWFAWFERPVAEAVGWTLLHFVWQGAAIWSVAALTLNMLRPRSARSRYVVACGALALMALSAGSTLVWCGSAWSAAGAARQSPGQPRGEERAAAFQVDRSTKGSDSSVVEPSGDVGARPTLEEARFPRFGAHVADAVRADVPLESTPAWKARLRASLPWLVAAWSFGVMTLSLRLLGIWIRVQRLCRVGVGPAGNETEVLLQRIMHRLAIARPVRILRSTLVQVPTVIGWLAPVVLIPAGTSLGLTPVQLEAILVHELAHISRWDYLVNLLQLGIETLLFYHPAVWWISSRIREERENCCDDLAASICGDRVGYAGALLRLEELRMPGGEIALAARGGNLLARVRRLLGVAEPNRPRPIAGGIIFVLLAVAGGVSAWTFAQGTEPARQVESGAAPPNAVAALAQQKAPQKAGQKAEPDQALTPALIADRMEQAMRQYDAIDYTVESDERRNTNAFMRSRPPVIVEGKGKFTYRSDGGRWLADEHSFSYNVGESQTFPRHVISGFDGSRHYHFGTRDSLFVWDEDDLGKERTHPRSVLWHGGRSTDNLLAVLRKSEAKIVRRVDVDNHPCVVVEADWVDEWDESRSPWHFEATISPEQAYLPLDTTWNYKGRLNVRTESRGLKRSDDGLWYPLMIRRIEPDDAVPRKIERIVSLDSRRDKPFRDEELRFSPPLGADVLNLRTRTAWHNDPWWPEMAPWLRDKLDWPGPGGVSELFHVESFCDPSMAGALAPPIEAQQWINGDPGGWNRKERFVSVLYFFGGRLVSPHPRWVSALRTWHAAWREDGVELIGIATSDSIDTARQGVEELGLTFPVAIDRPVERRGSFGRTFDAFKLQSYIGLVVVDPQGNVQLVATATDRQILPLEATMRRVFEAAGRKPKAPAVDPSSRQLDLAQTRAIEAEWKRVARPSTGSARIRGTLSLAKGPDETPAPTAGPIDIQVVPQFRMVGSDVPGSHLVHFDRDRTVSLKSDASGRYAIEGLRKGRYVVTFRRPGFAAVERDVLLADEFAEVVLDAELSPDTIAGQVVDDAGAQIRGATIKVTWRHLAPPRKSPATTANIPRQPAVADERGQFHLDQLYEGAYTFEISAPGYETSTIELVPLGRRDLKITLKPATK